MNIIDIARECGASTYRQLGADGQSIEFQEAALTAFADRIRADERERCMAILTNKIVSVKVSNSHRGRVSSAGLFAVALLDDCNSAIRTPGEKGKRNADQA